MSSAILYLAIVAIWAFLLVPRWIRRPGVSSVTAANTDAPPAQADTGIDEYATPGHYSPHFSNGRTLSPSGSLPPAEAGADDPDADTGPIPPVEAQPDGGLIVTAPATPARAARPPHPPLARGKIIQARRRLLTTLIALAIAAGACTALQLASPWVCVPPVIMLVLYTLLLREAATADAEHARRRAEHAAAVRRRRAAAARQAQARAAQPSAEIIDISARLTDQLYDQYADATIRAVGD